jgi:GYF domain 2
LRPEASNKARYLGSQLREFVARVTVAAETLVWSEGMTGWQKKAGEIPGLLSGASGPPILQPSDAFSGRGVQAGGSLAVHFRIRAFVGRALLSLIGLLFVIPAPCTSRNSRCFKKRV